MTMTSRPKVCVVGAGIIGLSTAVSLQTCGIDIDVTIIADKFSPDTTSDVASGLWLPHALGKTPMFLIRRWGEVTYKHFQKLFMSEQCAQTGVTQVRGYKLHRTTGNDLPMNKAKFIIYMKRDLMLLIFQNPDWKDIVGNFSILTDTELEQFPGMHEGVSFTTFLCEPTIYLPLLLSQFQRKKGKLIKQQLSTLEEIAAEYDIIVNCSGIGAHKLASDKELEPIRGQAIQVRAPWIKCFYLYPDSHTYIIPGVTKVTVVGTHQPGRWDATPNKEDTDDIWQKGCLLFPSLKGAEILRNVAGLRPGRAASVRLERGKDIVIGNRNVPVIHNYGHGGAGVSLHLGCAVDAVQLITRAFNYSGVKAKL